MNIITKNNLEDFLNKYQNFHDGNIRNIEYNIFKENIAIYLDVYNYINEPQKTRLKINFKSIKEITIKEIFSWDFINKAYIKYINYDEKEVICFANSEENPNIYIICDNIEYEEL